MKNRQYYKSKRRVLKYKNPTEAAIKAMRIATEVIINAIEIQKALVIPIPKYPNGGEVNECISENGREVIYRGGRFNAETIRGIYNQKYEPI